MNFKELVSFTGKTDRTIRTWIKKANIQGCEENAHGCAIDYSIDEVELILKSGSMSKDAVNILMQNARDNQQKQLPSQVNEGVLMTFMLRMQEQQQQFMTAVLNELKQTKPKEQLLLPNEPQEEPRAYLNRLVREYSQLKGVDFRIGWNVLYTEFLYRCKTNIKVKSKNEGIKPIDYLERESLLLTGCSIMKGLIDG